MAELIDKEEAYAIIGACMEVHNELGAGFLEPVYQEALGLELGDREIPHQRERELNIRYKGRILNKKYNADFVCHDGIIVELKALDQLTGVHESQAINYLKATGYRLALLVNFGTEKLQYKRIVL